jgi:hypothetical protein
LLIFADSANSKFADFADLLKSAKNENPAKKPYEYISIFRISFLIHHAKNTLAFNI